MIKKVEYINVSFLLFSIKTKSLNSCDILFLDIFEVEKVRWRDYFWLIVVVSLLCSVLVLGDSSPSVINVVPVKNMVRSGEPALFNLTIQNTLAEKQRYTVYSFVQGWSVDPFPLSDKIIELSAGNSYTTTVKAVALDSFYPGIYYVSVTIESDHGERQTKSLKVYLAPDQPVDYLPSIKVDVDMNEKVNPQNPLSIKLFLENKNPLNLKDLNIKLQSEMPEFTKDVVISLPSLEKKMIEFAVTPNMFQQPKYYTLFFIFEKDGQQVKVVEKKIEVIPLMPPFEVKEELKIVYWKQFRDLTFTNKGNVLNTQEVKIPVTFWQALLSQTEAKVVKENGQRYLQFELTLGPNEKAQRMVIVHYRLLVYLLVFIVLFVLFYWYVQPPIYVKKTAITHRHEGDEALSEVKVMLEVRNKSDKPLHNVSVVDTIPAIANLEKSLELGTLKPHEIKHTKNGTKVIWSLMELDGKEHRLITYKVKAKLNILGTFSLPRAVVEFPKGKKRRGKAYSNLFRLGP